jgi:hypothetical protein
MLDRHYYWNRGPLLISVLENKRKAKGSPIYTPEAISAIDEITKALGVDGLSKLSEMIKDKTKPCDEQKD